MPNITFRTKRSVEEGEITVRAMIPGTGDEGQTYPLLLWTHGGGQLSCFLGCFELTMYHSSLSPFPGFIFGNVDQDDYYMWNLSIDLQVTTLNAEYQLSQDTLLFILH